MRNIYNNILKKSIYNNIIYIIYAVYKKLPALRASSFLYTLVSVLLISGTMERGPVSRTV